MKNRRFFWQIFPAALFIIILSISATSWYGARMIQSFHYHEMQEDIKDRALLLRPHINTLLHNRQSNLQDFCRQTGRAAATRITVIAGDGRVLADSNENPEQMDNHGTRPEIQTAFTGEVGASLRFSKTLSQNMLYVAIPLHPDSPGDGVLRLSVSGATLDAVLSSIHTKLLYGIMFIAFLAAGLSYYLARRISRPLEKMRQGAERLASGDTEHPIIIYDTSAPREITELSHSLNNMAEQLNGRIRIISQQRNELEAVFSSMTDGVLAIAPDHTIIRINQAAAEILCIDHRTVQGMLFEGAIRNRLLQQFFESSLNSREAMTRELSLMENGQQMNLRVHAHALYDGENSRLGSLIVLHNLTRITQLENIRQDFVANVSHELKTPITAIRGYVETLLDGAMDDREAATRFLQIIQRQGMQLDAIVDDLLTLARIEDTTEKRQMDLELEPVQPILDMAMQTCQVGAKEKNIRIRTECIPDTIQVWGNRAMLEQAIINLLTNAVAYSPTDSTILLKARRLESSGTDDTVCITVQDQGPGIDGKHQKRIFERFYRCDKARSRKHGGTGLGLAIVKHIADSHNGRVELKSEPGNGAAFSLILPGSKNQGRTDR